MHIGITTWPCGAWMNLAVWTTHNTNIPGTGVESSIGRCVKDRGRSDGRDNKSVIHTQSINNVCRGNHGNLFHKNRILRQSILYYLVYNHVMLEPVFQILAVYLFAATPCFAGWIANGGKRDDIGIPIVTSILLFLLFGVLILFFKWFPKLPLPYNNLSGIHNSLHGSSTVCIARSNNLMYLLTANLPGSSASPNPVALAMHSARVQDLRHYVIDPLSSFYLLSLPGNFNIVFFVLGGIWCFQPCSVWTRR